MRAFDKKGRKSYFTRRLSAKKSPKAASLQAFRLEGEPPRMRRIGAFYSTFFGFAFQISPKSDHASCAV